MSDLRCRADSPIRCDSRARAMAAQDFAYVWGWGWVWWRAQNPTVPWRSCPWCAGALPDMERLAAQAAPATEGTLDTFRQADGADVRDDGEGAE